MKIRRYVELTQRAFAALTDDEYAWVLDQRGHKPLTLDYFSDPSFEQR